MNVVLTLDKGMVEQLVERERIKAGHSKGLTGEEVSVEINDKELAIEIYKKHNKKIVEISDINGGFELVFEATKDKIEKFKDIAGL